MIITNCCLCNSRSLRHYSPITYSPPANNLAENVEISFSNYKYPLNLVLCNDCSHVQLGCKVDPKILFSQYAYETGISSAFHGHFSRYAADISSLFVTEPTTLRVLDIGSNDGTLLDKFKSLGWTTYGIEPATNLASKTSTSHHIFNNFITPELASSILQIVGKFDLITANNVFAHSRDLNAFVDSVLLLLNENGLFSLEVQYLADLLDYNYFDMIYHEHTSYHHIAPLFSFFRSKGLSIVKVDHVNTHGGSIRIVCALESSPYSAITLTNIHNLFPQELQLSPQELPKRLDMFTSNVISTYSLLSNFIIEYANSGYTIIGYTAPAKATTLISGLTSQAQSLITAVIDDAPFKHSKYIPCTSIKVFNTADLSEPQSPIRQKLQNKPLLVIIFAWNIAESIQEKVIKSFPWCDNILLSVPLPCPALLSQR